MYGGPHTSHINLQGHFRRLSEHSVKLLEDIMQNF